MEWNLDRRRPCEAQCPLWQLSFRLKDVLPAAVIPESKIFGPAHTVRMVAAADKIAPTPPIHFADSIPKDAVVFVSQPKGFISACWGGLMSTRARQLGGCY